MSSGAASIFTILRNLGSPHGDHLDYLVNGRYTIHMAIVATTTGVFKGPSRAQRWGKLSECGHAVG